MIFYITVLPPGQAVFFVYNFTKMNYLQFDFQLKDAASGEILLAELANAGFEGFEEDADKLKAFIKERELDEAVFAAIIAMHSLTFEKKIILPENWNAKWESSFEPVRVHDFAAIRTAFHAPVTDVQYEIIITPKMSFGTGHHATTYLMIEQMSALDFNAKTVLDFGTGTGVLAILAEKMGAAALTAIDNDDWSIENAMENITANACQFINIQKAETIPLNKLYDIILANINLNVILSNLAAIAAAAKPGSILLLSGCIKNDEPGLAEALAGNGFRLQALTQKGEWICLKAVKA